MGETPCKIAVLLPCYNEETTIVSTIRDFHAALPHATIYVYDNNSRDGSAVRAREAGAIVRTERMQGKGHVVRRMFADIDADIYVLADGDATYDASAAMQMVAMLRDQQLDMVVGARRWQVDANYRRGHRFGNWLLTSILDRIFGSSFTDILSGYRVFSRRFVKSFPALSQGFEIETEISIHALELRMPIAEIVTRYAERPEGSVSKLSTYRDGMTILMTMIHLFRTERPIPFFSALAAVTMLIAFGLSEPLFITYLQTGLVPRLPTAVLVMGLTTLAILNLFCGLILDTVVRGRLETRRLAYLALPAPLPSTLCMEDHQSGSID